MKKTILLFAVIFGTITATYSQLNIHRKWDTSSELFKNKKNYNFGNYKFDSFSGSLNNRAPESFNMFPTKPAPGKFAEQLNEGDRMPCFYPKSEDSMPCFKPSGAFSMRVFKPKSDNWGILW